MFNLCVGLDNLPDEILMIIFKKLNNLEVLYSLQGVNQRLNKIIHDRIFASHLNFFKWLSHNFIDSLYCEKILNRFCLQILPEIHDKIEWLSLESSYMKRILHATDYPNLHVLGLNNLDEESARCLCTDETLASGIFKNQITALFITIDSDEDYGCMLSSVANIFNYISNAFTRLTALVSYELSYKSLVRLNFDDALLLTFRSSTLLQLHTRVQCFEDCLHLLDGRFNQLHTFSVDVCHIHRPDEIIINQDSLPNMKRFSLSCNLETYDYNETIVPLLHRMPHLEQLHLYLLLYVDETFIDGNYLKRNIINCMPQLNEFQFYFNSFMFTRNKLNLPTTKDIQRTFMDFPNNKIVSYVDYFPEAGESHCHIYSYPSPTEYYDNITNNFPGGLFKYVRVVSLVDEHPFEHEFFLQIVQSFPFVEELTLSNERSQNRKQSYESKNNNNGNVSLIKYSFLNALGISNVHDDYIEQFLFNTKTYFNKSIHLKINYESLQRVTHNFTRDATRINCSKVNKLRLCGEIKCSNSSLEEYFPCAKIYYPFRF